MLIQRVDIVTGGASASWGSDAVGGVVNFVTDKKFEGFKANLQGGITTYGDDTNATAQAAFGSSFLGGRLHLETELEYSYNAGVNPTTPASFGQVLYPGGRRIFSTYGTVSRGTAPANIPNNATCGATNTCASQFIYAPLAQTQINAQPYGIVVNGPKQGSVFINGLATPFNYAGGCTPSGATAVIGSINGTCFGTAADPGDQTHGFTHTLVDPLTRGDWYSRVSYDLDADTEVYATANLATSKTQDVPAQGNSSGKTVPFHCDNAFLPATGLFGTGLSEAATDAACLAAYPTNAFNVGESSANIPVNQVVNLTRDQRRFVLGGDGAFTLFGTDLTWDSNFEHGEADTTIRILNEPLKNRFNLAQDAIQDPVTGVVECRDANARANGCVPYNPFTTTPASQATVAYIDNQNNGSKIGGPLAEQYIRQDAFDFDVNASPIEDWAGKVTVVAGYDYRNEYFAQTADPYAGGITASTPANSIYSCTDPSIDCVASSATHTNPGNWNAGNYTSGGGNFHVNEVFAEFGVPLWNDNTFGKIDADIAGRFERYSTAGDISAWKVGLTWDTPLPGVRLRALQSRDVRAPNLADLFLPRQTLNGSFNNDFAQDPVTGQIPATGLGEVTGQTNAGNPLLKPERGQTTEAGIVYQPDWLPGFQASFDYYRIAVKGIISASGVQTVEDLCFQGFSSYCSQTFITTANGQPQTRTAGAQGLATDANKVIAIVAVPFNSAGLLTDGFDIEASYAYDLEDWDIPGHFVNRVLINHTMKFLSDPGVAGQFTTEKAGVLGGGFNSDTYSANTGNVLTWKATLDQVWQGDIFGFDLQERWLAGGVMDGKYTSANNPLSIATGDPGLHYVTCGLNTCPLATPQEPTVNYQRVPSIFYLDVGSTYNYTDKTQLYFHVDNVANELPPNTGNNEVNNTLYDVIGRMYRIGVRFNN